jgi:hypothetical protein
VVCLTPAFVEDVLRQAGFQIDASEVMLNGITILAEARKPGRAPAGPIPPAAGGSAVCSSPFASEA